LEAPEGVLCSGNYEVLSEGPLDPVYVSVTDSSPEHVVIWERAAEEENVFQFAASNDGPFWLCLHNGSPESNDGQDRMFGFAFRRARDVQQGGDVGKDEDHEIVEHFEQTMNDLQELVEHAQTIQNHQEYMRLREELHRNTVESTCTRILYWNTAEAVILLCLAFWQVRYIRKFFEVKRSL